MESSGHSLLLKFLVSGRDTIMEPTTANIESEVPGEQNIRGAVANDSNATENETVSSRNNVENLEHFEAKKENESVHDGNTNEIAVADDFTLDPVITITKQEATFSKGDLKLQKVIVTEDISHTSSNKDTRENFANRRMTYEIQTKLTRPADYGNDTKNNNEDNPTPHKSGKEIESKTTRTRIPMARFRQAVEKVRKESKEKETLEKEHNIIPKRKSSIPRLKDSKIPPPPLNKITKINKEENTVSSKADEEFDKIFQAISPTEDMGLLETINSKIENASQVESSFEELIHAYDEHEVQPTNIEKVKQSKIPLLKRKSEHEIEIPNRARSTLEKSISLDTSKIKSFNEETDTLMTEQRNITTEEISKTYTQTKITTESVILRSDNTYTDNFAVIKSCDIQIEDSTNNNNLTTVEKNTDEINVTSENITQDQQLNKNEIKELVKVAVPVYNLPLSLDKIIESIPLGTKDIITSDEKEFSTQENTISGITKEYCTFDKQNASKVSENDVTQRFIRTSAEILINNDTPITSINETKFKNNNNETNEIDSKMTKSTAVEIKEIAETLTEQSTQSNKISTQTDMKSSSETNTKTAMEEDILILRGKVNRIIHRISSIEIAKPVENEISNIPKKKSILSKIAMFERDEVNEPFPTRVPKIESKIPRVLTTQRQTSKDPRRPKIVKEVLKDSSEQNVLEISDNNFLAKFTSAEKKETTTNISSIHIGRSTRQVLSNTVQIENATKTELHDLESINNKCEKDVVNEIEGASKISEKVNTIKHETKVGEMPLKNEIADKDLVETEQMTIKKYANIIETKELKHQTSTEGNLYKTYNNKNECLINNTSECMTEILNNEALSKISNGFNSNHELDKTVTNYKYKTISDLNLRDANTDKLVGKANTVKEFDITYTGKTFPEISDSYNQSASATNENESKNVCLNREHSMSDSMRQDNEVFTKNTIEEDKIEPNLKHVRTREEFDIRRTTSVAELDLGNIINGKVRAMIIRMNSLERLEHGKKEIISAKERPRKRSVSEKIALFEGKLSPAKTEKKELPRKVTNATEEVATNQMENDELYRQKIAELINAKKTYGTVNVTYQELRDGSKMPVIALGTALLDKSSIKHVVEAAIDLGYRAIDTAYIYGNEKEVGEAIKTKIDDGTVKREDLYIISKLWSTFHRRDLVEKACKASLRAMGLTYFDLILIHNPMSLLEGDNPLPKIANVLQFSEHDYLDAWYGIEDLIQKGLVRRGGVSNFNSEQVRRVMEKGRLKPVVNQVECHPYLSQARLDSFCDAFGVKLNCYGTLGSKGTPAEWKSGLPAVIDDPLVLVMAAGIGVTPAQLLVAYQLHNGRSVTAKSSRAAHLYENLSAQQLRLEAAHLTALDALNRNKRMFNFKGLGETHKNYPFKIAF